MGGLHLKITDMTLPMKSGLSSSAAICVMVAKAFNQLYDLHMNTLGLMNIAYWGNSARLPGVGVWIRPVPLG